MPDCVMVHHPVELEPGERKLYEKMKDDLLVYLNGEAIEAANVAVLSGKLLQLAGGAIYTADREVVHIHEKQDILENFLD